jgi:UDP-N-acetylmuramate dehydrogenase
VIGLADAAARLEARLPPGRVQRDFPSGELTTYRVGGPLAVLVRVAHEDDLGPLAAALRDLDLPLVVVGAGSNLLVADAGFPGIAVMLAADFEHIAIDTGAGLVTAGGIARLPVVARRAAREGVAGLEFYVGIPGSVGGAVRMNAGGHGRETRDVLVDARLVDLRRGEVETRANADLGFAYRHSNVGADTLVLSARFRVSADERAACAARIDEIVRWRREHQPGGANAGSVFSNPPDDSAGRLIDAAGLKGLRVGGASVSTKHANFIQAEPGATAHDVHALIGEVRRRVVDATGIVLEPEVRLVGFGGTDGGA